MKKSTVNTIGVMALLLSLLFGYSPLALSEKLIALPSPMLKGQLSLEETLIKRRSVRKYSDYPLKLQEISQLLWATQGITHHRGYRTAPSAGALYPLEIYVVSGNVEGLEPGVYHYLPDAHALEKTGNGDKRGDLSKAALNQAWVRDGAAVFVITAAYERTTRKYRQRGIRYVHMEAGHAGQNLFLQAVSLGIGTVVVGAFNDDKVRKVLRLDEKQQPLSLMPVAYPR